VARVEDRRRPPRSSSRRPEHVIEVLDDAELDGVLAYWDAANYLTVAQIYPQDNPLLREPLPPEHIEPRLLGHWAPRRV
jgi:phosphoketolase